LIYISIIYIIPSKRRLSTMNHKIGILAAVVLLCLPAATCRPFTEERVSIEVNERVTLAGTLSIPDGSGPFPAVILISGSGLQTRDSNLWGFKLYKTTAHHLSSRGVAVLRCDDRGFGGSTGNPGATANTTLDFADDVLAQVEYLKRRPEVDVDRIGLLGQSEGAIVASMVDARSDDIEFVILLAGPAVPVRRTLDDQLAANMRLAGRDEEAIAARLELWQRIWNALERDEDTTELREELHRTLRADFALKSPAERERHGSAEAYADRIVKKEFGMMGSKWGRFLVTYDPQQDLSKMNSRVLALYGGKDVQVAAEINAPALGETFREAGKENYDIRILQEANHLFQQAETGAVSEYAELPREFVPGFLEAIEAWVKANGYTAPLR
jgi:pimeloyl-ACP methyl ester carboxylesterase